MRNLALGAAALALAGCASVPPEQRLVDACNSYAGVLDTLAVHVELGTLSDAQIARVDALNERVLPLCALELQGMTLHAALDEIERSLEQLIITRRQAGGS